MTTERASSRQRFEQTSAFVERALKDFELFDAFLSRPLEERTGCLKWIDAAIGEAAQEDRVSRMLDCLAFGKELPAL